MRRLHRGWLAAPLLLLVTGCGVPGSGAAGSGATAEPTSVTEIVPPPALVAERDGPAADVAAAGDVRVLVVGVDGARSPGFDAAVSTLLATPGTAVVAAAVGGAPDPDATTMTGYPVRVLPGGVDDILAGTDGLDDRPALVVVGMTPRPLTDAHGHESPAVAVARLAAGSGVPAVVVTVDAGRPDYAAASLELTALLDHELDRLLHTPSAVVLTVDGAQAMP